MTTLAEITAKMKEGAAKKSSFGNTVKFATDQGVVYIDGNQNPPTVSNDDTAADCTIKMDFSDFSDLIAGNLDLIFDGMPAIMPHVREGRLRPLAVGSQQRVTYVPGIEQVPGMAELIPGTDMDMEFWYCISAPAGTPPEVAAALHRATVGAAAVPSYREKLLPLGFDVVTDASPAAFTSFMRDQEALWRDLVAVSGVKLD